MDLWAWDLAGSVDSGGDWICISGHRRAGRLGRTNGMGWDGMGWDGYLVLCGSWCGCLCLPPLSPSPPPCCGLPEMGGK